MAQWKKALYPPTEDELKQAGPHVYGYSIQSTVVRCWMADPFGKMRWMYSLQHIRLHDIPPTPWSPVEPKILRYAPLAKETR